MGSFEEKELEEVVIELLKGQGYEYLGNEDEYSWTVSRKLDDFVMIGTLTESIEIINSKLSNYAIDTAIKTLKNMDNPSLFERNNKFHEYLINGIEVEEYEADVNPLVKLIDFENVNNNIFNVVNQIKFNEGRNTRIPDVILYINGLPVVVFELKSVENYENTQIERAYEQLGENTENSGYRYDIPTLFNYNEICIISDGVTSKVGTLTSGIKHYKEWKSINGEVGYNDTYTHKLNVLIEGLLKPSRLLEVIKFNIFFTRKNKEKPQKILGGYHQYFGVNKSKLSIEKHIKPNGDGKAGIIWHTQGSGKSFSMVMLAHRIITDKALENPTIIVLTDRNDLDEQLFTTFSTAKEFLRCEPVKVTSRQELTEKLSKTKAGGIYFATLQKFDKDNIIPNTRNNIIVIADEAHRSHYGIEQEIKLGFVNKIRSILSKNDIELITKYGYAKYIRDVLPNATFIGFTGTPVETKDKSTSSIFGDIIDTYDMTQSIEDGATVKLFYESRLAKVWLDESKVNEIDKYYEDLQNENISDELIERSKKQMSTLEILLEDDDVIDMLVKDIISHYEERKDMLNGKAMIVAMNRKIAYKIYKKILEIRPNYEEKAKVVVTESNKDSEEERILFGNKQTRENIAKDFKDENGSTKIVIVVDMWLTGFDVQDLDVMYVYKKMKGHNLMQAIARVNRVYNGKDSGLVVDYIGLEKALNEALDTYTARDKEFNLKNIQDTAKVILDEKISILDEWFYQINRSKFSSQNAREKFEAIQQGSEFVLGNDNRKRDYLAITGTIKNAYIMTVGILDEPYKQKVNYYLTIRCFIQKLEYGRGNISVIDINKKVSELLEEAIKGDEVKVLTKIGENDDSDIWELLKPEKIEQLRKSNPPHIFIKMLEKLLAEAIREYKKTNLIKSQEYSKRLRQLLELYNNRKLDEELVEETIVGLVSFSQDMVKSEEWANKNDLKGRERAFYDALATEKSALEIMGDETLRLIASKLKEIVEEYATIDWNKKKQTQAKMRSQIKRLLKEYNYPPEYEEIAVENVINQAEYMM